MLTRILAATALTALFLSQSGCGGGSSLFSTPHISGSGNGATPSVAPGSGGPGRPAGGGGSGSGGPGSGGPKTTSSKILIQEPQYGFNVIPGSTRRIHAAMADSSDQAVDWAIGGGSCNLSASSGPYVDVTAGASGSSCSISGTTNGYGVNSATSCSILAKLHNDPTQTASITVNICDPAVEISTVPFYSTLYAGQSADVQALVWGSTNTNVTWSISQQPNSGDGSLVDSGNRDTVFSATAPGRYVLTATSNADPTKTATAIMYVTGHPQPYNVTNNKTMPVDCTADPQMSGMVYDVGPTQAYHRLQDVPWPSLAAGSTVRVHNEDTSGSNPSTFHEYVQISASGAADQPIRVCGVADPQGNLPVVSGDNATGRTGTSQYAAGYGGLTIYNNSWGYYGSQNAAPKYIIVEGLKVQRNYKSYLFTPPGGGAPQNYQPFMSGIRINNGMDIVVRGNEITDNGLGFFNDAQNPESKMVRNVLLEGNNLHNNGVVGAYSMHQAYIQAFGEVTQFNIFDAYRSGAQGSNLKSRGVYDIVRYNYFGDGALRQNDFVDQQDGAAYLTFEGFLSGGANSFHALYPADLYGADRLASVQEAWHNVYVYGNVYRNSTANAPLHFSGDMDIANRAGSLWWYNNTFYEACTACGYWSWVLFDTGGAGGGPLTEVEWQQIHVINNLIWLQNPAQPFFYWNRFRTQFTSFGKNLITAGWGTDDEVNGGDGTGWAQQTPSWGYMDGTNQVAHIDQFTPANILTTSANPVDPVTYRPVPGSLAIAQAQTLPNQIQALPVRFQFNPATGFATPRTTNDLGALSSY